MRGCRRLGVTRARCRHRDEVLGTRAFEAWPASCVRLIDSVWSDRGPGVAQLKLVAKVLEVAMDDVVYLGLTLGFFAVSWAFIKLCDRL